MDRIGIRQQQQDPLNHQQRISDIIIIIIIIVGLINKDIDNGTQNKSSKSLRTCRCC
jgi:hypothetical protein